MILSDIRWLPGGVTLGNAASNALSVTETFKACPVAQPTALQHFRSVGQGRIAGTWRTNFGLRRARLRAALTDFLAIVHGIELRPDSCFGSAGARTRRANRALRAQRNLLSRINVIWVVQSPLAKIFRLTRRANQGHWFARPTPKEGRCATSSTRGGMRWTRMRF